MYTWKIVYYPPLDEAWHGRRGVALIEATARHMAIDYFQQQYKGQFSGIESCEKLLG